MAFFEKDISTTNCKLTLEESNLLSLFAVSKRKLSWALTFNQRCIGEIPTLEIP
jgi:hypothetical protein